MTDEARALAHVYEAGVAVPEVVHICAPEDGLGLGYIMRFIEGQTIARKILRDDEFSDTRRSWRRNAAPCWRACTGLSDQMEGLPSSDAKGELDKYTGILRAHGHPHPVLSWQSDGWPTMCHHRRRTALCMATSAWAI